MPKAQRLQARAGGGGGGGGAVRRLLRTWVLRVGSSFVIWMTLMQLTAVVEDWHPRLHRSTAGDAFSAAGCMGRPQPDVAANLSVLHPEKQLQRSAPPALPPRRMYKSIGYLRVSCNGGLNQMRAAICDMVTVARFLNLTLVIPELDKTSFWADPSDFKDIFDVRHFIDTLRDEVKIVRSTPAKFNRKLHQEPFSLPPVSWSDEKYYIKQILPLVKKHKIIHFNKTDTRLANNGLPIVLQRLRCRINFEALKFTSKIEALGKKLLSILRKSGSFVVLHLRYEMDMLSFSGCTHECLDSETEELTRMRYAYPWWKEKEIDSEKKRLEGLCPLTPEEMALVLQAIGFASDTLIYIASGETYGGERRMAHLRAAYPKIVRKEMLLSPDELGPFHNHSTQMAALDYLVSVASDVFIPTYDGNMAKLVEGHRRYLGFQKTILLDRKHLVELLDLYNEGKLSWNQFATAVREVHKYKMGQPSPRKVFPERPKEEDYFYANPQECFDHLRNSKTESRVFDT